MCLDPSVFVQRGMHLRVDSIKDMVEHSMDVLGGDFGNVGELSRRIADFLCQVGKNVGWNIPELLINLILPTLVFLKNPKTRTFGVLLASLKAASTAMRWQECPEKYREAIVKVVRHHFLSGSEVTTGAWLVGQLHLEGHFTPEELFEKFCLNLQALRVYCGKASKPMQRFMIRKLVDSGCDKTRRERRIILSQAADLIIMTKANRNDFPEVARYKALNWLCFLVHKVPWWVAEDYALNNAELLGLCVDQLLSTGSNEGAVAIYQRHEKLLEGVLLPKSLKKVRGHPAVVTESGDHFGPRTAAALTLPLTEDQIIWVDTEEAIRETERIVSQAPLAGTDLEWSGMGEWLDSNLALLQVAVPGRVFLVDLCAHGVHDAVDSLLRVLLGNERPVLVGFSFENDVREIRASPWNGACDVLRGICDLQVLATTGSKKNHDLEGLGSLVKRTLGRPLCKAEQRSCWHRRPLRPGQLYYAALDAYVLLQVAAAVVNQPLGDGFHVASSLESLMTAHGGK